ncbi:MAG: ArnT family glycosyltransferase [Vicinamibacterales bacterium]
MKRAAAILDVAIACGLALAAVLAVSNGFTLDVGAFSIRLHDWMRPSAATAGLVAIRLWLWSRSRPRTEATSDAHAWRVAEVALLAVSLSAIGYWVVFLTTICGGSDSYGYVSASELISRGRLIEPQPIAAWLPVVNPLDVATPAGYVAAVDLTGIAPSYPLGLPVLMAIAQIAFGPLGPYLVPLLCGIVLLLVSSRLASTWYGPQAGWLAAALVGWDAVVVTYAKQPMSDVPAAMFAVLSMWWLVRPSPLPLSAGLAAGASFLTRPGGIGMIAVLAIVAAWPRDSRRRGITRFLVGLVPFVVAQALLQWRLFGSPLTSGYGSMTQLFAGGTVWSNLRIYLEGLWTTHSAVWFAGLVAACLVRSPTPAIVAIAALTISAVPYVLYLEFAHWETLRFLLPAIVLLTIAAAGGLASTTARLGNAWIAAAVLVIVAVLPAAQSERFLRREGVPQLMEAESRYPLVAAHLKDRTPASAIVLAAQHSGSIRHYGDRLTLRWDVLRSEDLEPLMGALAERGHPLYVVLEGAEQERFSTRFAAPLRHVRMYPFGQVRNTQIWELAR